LIIPDSQSKPRHLSAFIEKYRGDTLKNRKANVFSAANPKPRAHSIPQAHLVPSEPIISVNPYQLVSSQIPDNFSKQIGLMDHYKKLNILPKII
jgi:hypothetical protein